LELNSTEKLFETEFSQQLELSGVNN